MPSERTTEKSFKLRIQIILSGFLEEEDCFIGVRKIISKIKYLNEKKIDV